jgi:type IV pilus assembly protein PilZ
VAEHRQFGRSNIDVPLTFMVRGKPELHEGRGRDLSIGGMFIETSTPAPFNSDLDIMVVLPGAAETSTLPARVRWERDGGMGVQFGLLGARETHLIAKLARPK